MLKFRSYHYPIQYICSTWQFMDLQVKLKPPILIPRFQTSQMLSILFENQKFTKIIQQKKKNNEQFKFLQFGCGSGVIGLSIAKLMQKQNIKFKGQMIDISKQAVKLSKLNMKLNNIQPFQIDIKQGDMIKILQEKTSKYFNQTYDLIISNPPYISLKQYSQKSFQFQVKKYQSKQALIGCQSLNQNGLFYIEKILKKIYLEKFNNKKKFVNQSDQSGKQTKKNISSMIVLQYGGQDLSYLNQKLENYVFLDYYQRRRFIMILPQ